MNERNDAEPPEPLSAHATGGFTAREVSAC